MAIPFLSTFLAPPSVPRGESFLEFPADDSLNHFMTEGPTALAFIKSILYPFLLDVGLPGIIDLAKTPPSAVTAATKEFRRAITEEHSVFLQSHAKTKPGFALPSPSGAQEDNDAGPLPHWAGMEHFYEDGAFEGHIGYSDFYDAYLKFCALRNYVGSKRATRPVFYSETADSYTINFEGKRRRWVTPGIDGKRRKVALVTFPPRKRSLIPLAPEESTKDNSALRRRWKEKILPSWYPKRDSLLSLWTPVFTSRFECGKLELAGDLDASSKHVMVITARIVDAGNTIPKN